MRRSIRSTRSRRTSRIVCAASGALAATVMMSSAASATEPAGGSGTGTGGINGVTVAQQHWTGSPPVPTGSFTAPPGGSAPPPPPPTEGAPCLGTMPYAYPSITGGAGSYVTHPVTFTVPAVRTTSDARAPALSDATATLPPVTITNTGQAQQDHAQMVQTVADVTNTITQIFSVFADPFFPGGGAAIPPWVPTQSELQLSIAPPAEGVPAYADFIPEWSVKQPIAVTGTWHMITWQPPDVVTTGHRQKQDPNFPNDPTKTVDEAYPISTTPPRINVGWECINFTVTATGQIELTVPAAATTGAGAGSIQFRSASDSQFDNWAPGNIFTEPLAATGKTYVHVPTCAAIERSQRPNVIVSYPLPPVQVPGSGGHGEPVMISVQADVTVAPQPVVWNFGAGGQGAATGRGNPPQHNLPQYDAVHQQWSDSCQVHWEYNSVNQTVSITASQVFNFTISSWFNNGAGQTTLTPISYSRVATWGPVVMSVNQIQGIPVFNP